MKALVFSLFTGFAVLSAASVHAADPPPVQTQTGDAPAQAGGKGNKGARAARLEEKFNELKTALNPTPDQEQKIKSLFGEQIEAAKNIKTDTTLTKEQKQAKMKESRAAFDTKLTALLTPEQKAKWEALKKTKKAGGGASE